MSVDSIIAEALKSAGVPESDITIPPEIVQGEPAQGVPNLDGTPKGQTKGETPLEKLENEEPVDETPKPSEPKSGESPEQPLSKSDIETIITQATSKLQSLVDRKISGITTSMQQTNAALNQFFQTQEDSAIAGLPENEQLARRLERLEKGGTQAKIQVETTQPQPDAVAQQLYQYLIDMTDIAGLKKEDKRLDWAGDLAVGQTTEIVSRFKTSVKSALAEDQEKSIKDLKSDSDKVIAGVRKKTGVDKVSTSGPSGNGLPDLSKLTPMQKIELGIKIQEEQTQINK